MVTGEEKKGKGLNGGSGDSAAFHELVASIVIFGRKKKHLLLATIEANDGDTLTR